jgi:hypothetical protein
MPPPYEKRLLEDHLIEGVTLEMLSMVPMNPAEPNRDAQRRGDPATSSATSVSNGSAPCQMSQKSDRRNDSTSGRRSSQ